MVCLPTSPSSHDMRRPGLSVLLRNRLTALALATPVRTCAITGTTLPTHFLHGFRLAMHPDKGDYWFVPRGLEKWQPPARTSPNLVEDGGDASTVGTVPAGRKSTGPTAWTLSRMDLLKEFFRHTSRYRDKQRTLMRQTTSNMPHVARILDKAIWRQDMASFLLEIMRRRVVEGLLFYAEQVEQDDRKYLIQCDGWEDAKRYNHRGCLLYFGSEPDLSPGLPVLSTIPIENVRFGGKLVVHDMRALLTPDQLRYLREQSSVLRSGSLLLLGRRRTNDLQLLLWKLQNYISHDHGLGEEISAGEKAG